MSLEKEDLACDGMVVDVTFTGETGVGSGVARDWVSTACRELFDPERGLFEVAPGHPHIVHPNPMGEIWHPLNGPDAPFSDWMEFAGRLVGLAIRIGAPIGFHLGRAEYRMLHDPGASAELEDMREMHPAVYSSCAKMLECSTQEELDEMQLPGFATGTMSLLPGVEVADAAEVRVTLVNRSLLVQQLADHYAGLDGCARRATASIRSGMVMMSDLPDGAKLMATIAAVPRAEFNALCGGDVDVPLDGMMRNTNTTNTCSTTYTTHTVRVFWDVVRDMDNRQRRMLLQFWTGTSSLMPRARMEIVVTQAVHATNALLLPTARTCYMQLWLPCGETMCTKDEMSERIRIALESSYCIHDDNVV
jgi:hypothetical protein